MAKENLFIRKRIEPYIGRMAATFIMLILCFCLVGYAEAPEEANDEPIILMEGTIPSVEQQKAYVNREIGLQNICKYVADGEAVYGITEDGEAVLMDLYREVLKPITIENIVIPEEVEGYPVVAIKSGAVMAEFADEIKLPSALRVWEGGPYWDYGLEAMNIPESLDYIGRNRFADKSPWYQEQLEQSKDGMLIINGNLLQCDSEEKTLVIPEGVKYIGAYALEQCPAEEVVLPESIQEVYSIPMGLKQMNIPKNLRYIELSEDDMGTPWFQQKITDSENGMVIVNGILLYCGMEGKVSVPEGVWSISGAFRGREKLTEISLPESVLTINNQAFRSCTGLTEIVLPESLLEIKRDAFKSCTGLKTITFGEQIQRIEDYAFSNCIALESIVFPESLRVIGDGAFLDCGNLKEVILPSNLLSISYAAFTRCEKMESITLSESLKHIGTSAFSGCHALKSICIPDSVEYIEASAFYNCGELTNIRIGEGVRFVGHSIFGCGKSGINDGWNPEVLPDIDKEVVIELPTEEPESRWSWNRWDGDWFLDKYGLYNRKNVMFVVYPGGSSEEEVRNEQYRYYDSAQNNLILPDTETLQMSPPDILVEGKMPEHTEQTAFLSRNADLDAVRTYIEQENMVCYITEKDEAVIVEMEFSPDLDTEDTYPLVVPEEVQGYPVAAIKEEGVDAWRIHTITLPSSLRVLEEDAIDSSYGLQAVMLNADIDTIDRNSIDTDSPWYNNALGMVPNGMLIVGKQLLYCNSKQDTLTIPNGVEVIVQGALEDCPAKEVILPEGLKELYSVPRGVQKMNIPESVIRISLNDHLRNNARNTPWFQEKIRQSGNGMVVINGILLYCGIEAEELTVPEGIWSISNAFHQSETLQKVILQEGVTEIGDYAFNGCKNLTEVVIPESIVRIGKAAFAGCGSLEGVKLGDGIQKIDKYAFAKCTALTEIALPKGIRQISAKCFRGCTMLENVIIPDNVTYIDNEAFRRCIALKGLSLPNSIKGIDELAFYGCEALEAVTIPDSVEFMGYMAFARCGGLRYIKMGEIRSFSSDVIFNMGVVDWWQRNDRGKKVNKEKPAEFTTVIELPEKLPFRVRLEDEDWNGLPYLRHMYGLQERAEVVFIVHKGSEAEEVIKRSQIERDVIQYQYRYYEE